MRSLPSYVKFIKNAKPQIQTQTCLQLHYSSTGPSKNGVWEYSNKPSHFIPSNSSKRTKTSKEAEFIIQPSNNHETEEKFRAKSVPALLQFPRIAAFSLDLSDCQMVHIAEGVYHLMKETEVKTLNVSGNVLTKVSPRLVIKFSLLQDLDISRNQIGTLPNELAALLHLEKLNMSNNCFTDIPECVYMMPALRELDASKNRITDIDNDDIKNAACLSSVDLTENPLTKRCIENLPKTGISFMHSPPSEEQEDWEDLNV